MVTLKAPIHQMEASDLGRSPLREVSNMRSPATGGKTATAPNSAGKPGFDLDATPPPAVWQSEEDDYKFVEEDDDEVMFSSALFKKLPAMDQATPPALLVAGDSTQDKQVPASQLCARCSI